MELKDTIGLMTSSDWKDRFVAEYLQTRYNRGGINNMMGR